MNFIFSCNSILQFPNAINFALNDISWLKQNMNKLSIEMCSSSKDRDRKLTRKISCLEKKRVHFWGEGTNSMMMTMMTGSGDLQHNVCSKPCQNPCMR